ATAPLLGQEERLVVCRRRGGAHVRLFFNVELEAARRPGSPGYQRCGGQSRSFCSGRGGGNWCFDGDVVFIPSLRPSQTGTLGLPTPFRADSLWVSICSDDLRRCSAIRASGNASLPSTAAARRFLRELAFGIEDYRTDENRTIHALAWAPSKGGGVLAGGVHSVLRLLSSWRTLPILDPSAG